MVERAVLEMIRYFGGDVRRINHILKVLGFTGAIAAAETSPRKPGRSSAWRRRCTTSAYRRRSGKGMYLL